MNISSYWTCFNQKFWIRIFDLIPLSLSLSPFLSLTHSHISHSLLFLSNKCIYIWIAVLFLPKHTHTHTRADLQIKLYPAIKIDWKKKLRTCARRTCELYKFCFWTHLGQWSMRQWSLIFPWYLRCVCDRIRLIQNWQSNWLREFRRMQCNACMLINQMDARVQPYISVSVH